MTVPRRPSALEQNGVWNQLRLELHLIHLELLRDRHGGRTVEARAAEMLRRAAADSTHEPGDREIRQAVGPDVLTHLFDRAAGRDQFLGRADVHAHEARGAHRRAPWGHVALARARGAK